MIMVKCDLCDWAGYFGFSHMFFFFASVALLYESHCNSFNNIHEKITQF